MTNSRSNSSIRLPQLPYASNALAPYIDEQTMELHHGKHHKAYTDNLRRAIEGTSLEFIPIGALLANTRGYAPVLRNNGGGYYNHTLFFQILGPPGSGLPSGEIERAINQRFGAFSCFKEQFNQKAQSLFGAGWVWLYVDKRKELQICSTPNQDNPAMNILPEEHQGTPIVGLDLWEHAYYLQYQNRRDEYVEAFWNVVNWSAVNERFIETQTVY